MPAADEHQLDTPVAPLIVPVVFDARPSGEVPLLFGLWKGGEPRPAGSSPYRLARFVDAHGDVLTASRPEKALRTNDFVREIGQQRGDSLGMERAVSLEDERADPVFCGGGLVVVALLEFAFPPGRLARPVEIEAARIENFGGVDTAVFGPNDLRSWLECLKDGLDLIEFLVGQ